MIEIEYKNKILIELNESHDDAIIIIKKLNQFIEQEKDYLNIVDVYLDKMIELEKELKEVGSTFYKNSPIGASILTYMNSIYEESFKCLNFALKFSDKSFASPLYYLYQEIIIRCINRYNRNCELLSNLSIEKDIIKMLKSYYKKDRIIMMFPGDYIKEYSSIKTVLWDLGLSNIIFKLQKNIDPIIMNKELSLNSDECVKMCLKNQEKNDKIQKMFF